METEFCRFLSLLSNLLVHLPKTYVSLLSTVSQIQIFSNSFIILLLALEGKVHKRKQKWKQQAAEDIFKPHQFLLVYKGFISLVWPQTQSGAEDGPAPSSHLLSTGCMCAAPRPASKNPYNHLHPQNSNLRHRAVPSSLSVL